MKTKNAKELFSFFIVVIALFTSCQKEVNQQPVSQSTVSDAQANCSQNDKAQVAIDWYKLQLQMILHANPAYPAVPINRFFGYEGISLFEAARFEMRNSISLHKQLNEMPVMPLPEDGKKYSWVIAANAAMANITRDLFPGLTTANHTSIDSLEKIYNDKITAIEGADVVARSQAFGDSVASAIFNWAKTDNFSHVNDPYTSPVGAGLWVPTPPLYLPAGAPYTGNCRTFLRRNMQGTTIPPLFKYSTDKNSAFYKIANQVYNISQSLTNDQKNIALFWNDVGMGIGYTPMGHNISIITQILTKTKANLATAEEAYVKAGIAMWDATIVCWRSKYKYNLVRPVTYIQQNISSTWTPFIVTPNFPEYPAAHAMITSSVMTALTSVFGRNYSFTDHTYDFLGYPARSYASFEQAANECGISRVYGGIHYRPSAELGHMYGNIIGVEAAAVQLTYYHW